MWSFEQYLALHEDNDIIFSVNSGFYKEEFDLKLTTVNKDCSIHYTLDGSEPTMNSEMYTNPIKITSRNDDDNEFISPFATYQQACANHIPNANRTKRATVIKACAFVDGIKVGAVSTNTYFVDDKGTELYSLPVVSLVCDPDDLFDDDHGIYVVGNAYAGRNNIYELKRKSTPANYNQRGEEWRKKCVFEYFVDSNHVYEHDLGIQIFGGSSRGESKKSFKLTTKAFSEDKIQYPFFDQLRDKQDTPIDTFDELIL